MADRVNSGPSVDNSGIGEEPEQDLRSELRTPPPAKRNFFDEARLGQFLDAARRADPQSAARSDSELLEQYEIVRKGQPTVAGILAFSRYPQQHFPRMTVTAVVIPGLQMGDTDAQGARFLDDRRFTGSIPEMLEDAVVFIRRNAGLRVEADGQGDGASDASIRLRQCARRLQMPWCTGMLGSVRKTRLSQSRCTGTGS